MVFLYQHTRGCSEGLGEVEVKFRVQRHLLTVVCVCEREKGGGREREGG